MARYLVEPTSRARGPQDWASGRSRRSQHGVNGPLRGVFVFTLPIWPLIGDFLPKLADARLSDP